jgi:hypothetical protein
VVLAKVRSSVARAAQLPLTLPISFWYCLISCKLACSRFLVSFIPIGKGILVGLLDSLLYFSSILLVKLLCVIAIDFLDLSLIVSTPKNSLISPRLPISSLEIALRSL